MNHGEHEKAAKTEHTPEPTDIHSPFNACMYRGHCKGLEKQRDELLAEFNAYKEGSEEAFGTVVAQNQAAEARLQTMQSTIVFQQGVICDFREQRDELLAALDRLKGSFEFGAVVGIEPEGCERALSFVNEAIANVKGGA